MAEDIGMTYGLFSLHKLTLTTYQEMKPGRRLQPAAK